MNTLAPILAAIVVGVEEVDAYLAIVIKVAPDNGYGMAPNQAPFAVGNRGTGGLRMNNVDVAVVMRVITGIKMANEAFMITDLAGFPANHTEKIMPYPRTIHFRVNPAVKVVIAYPAQAPHLAINAVKMRYQNQ